jgi:hypothetical protein
MEHMSWNGGWVPFSGRGIATAFSVFMNFSTSASLALSSFFCASSCGSNVFVV